MCRKILRRAGHEAAERGSLDQTAIIADISLSGFRIFGNPMPASDVRAIIETRRRNRDGKFIETALREQFIAFVNFLLAWPFINNHGFYRMIESVDPTIGDFIGLALESQAVNCFGTGEAAHQYGAVVFSFLRIGHIIEQKSFAGFFRQSSELPSD